MSFVGNVALYSSERIFEIDQELSKL